MNETETLAKETPLKLARLDIGAVESLLLQLECHINDEHEPHDFRKYYDWLKKVTDRLDGGTHFVSSVLKQASSNILHEFRYPHTDSRFKASAQALVDNDDFNDVNVVTADIATSVDNLQSTYLYLAYKLGVKPQLKSQCDPLCFDKHDDPTEDIGDAEDMLASYEEWSKSYPALKAKLTDLMDSLERHRYQQAFKQVADLLNNL